ncbi:MAG: pyridoxal 5'-phosphate synthase glutaminase subunit PdxT [Dehalococcoidales bacterium]|nr:pyridoxal 5'-phosphate synthase glutaminase subunit PdxT [Dehalococcoidales bacterium]
MRIGVLALQGGFIEHVNMLEKLGVTATPVYKPDELEGIDGLIIPGGESTTMINLMHEFGIFGPLKEKAQAELPVMGTCAGMLLLAKEVSNPGMETLTLIDISVKRNAFGRQIDSFEASVDIPLLGKEPFPAIFIRAPLIERTSPDVEILGRLNDGTAVAVRQERMLAVSFHPELTQDTRLHRYFLEIVADCLKEEVKSVREAAIPAD